MITKQTPLSPELRHNMNAYWRAANYLAVGQIYLYDYLLLKESLKLEHVKPRLLGHHAGPELQLRAPEPSHQAV
jgi:xylulose-5-phosphate/fructose-6-phosphate phosphoketolase